MALSALLKFMFGQIPTLDSYLYGDVPLNHRSLVSAHVTLLE
jgi:hypothetical protein